MTDQVQQIPKKRKQTWVDWLLLLLFVGALGVAGMSLRQYVTQPSGLLLTWSTENELDILGFNVYRASTADGTYERINEKPIPASTDPVLGDAYEFLDESVDARTTYYYQLETLFRDGKTERNEEPIILPPP